MTGIGETPPLRSRVTTRYPMDGLVSYHYFPGDPDMAPLINTGRLRLIGDSGAFSAHTSGTAIPLPTYAAWVTRWQEHLLWAASLDVIGDADASLRNWRLLRDRHGLSTVPTVHAGTDPARLDQYVDEGASLVGLGGMAGRGQAQRAWPWAVAMFRRARDRHPGVRFHLWGVTSRKYLDALPAWSADSSGTLSRVARFGSLRLFNPATGQDVTVRLQGSNVFEHGRLLRGVYGVDPADITTSHAGNRHILIALCAAVTQQYAGWLQRRHGGVTPPALLRWRPSRVDGTVVPCDPGVGPRVHLVSTGEDLLISVGADVPRTRRAAVASG